MVAATPAAWSAILHALAPTQQLVLVVVQVDLFVEASKVVSVVALLAVLAQQPATSVVAPTTLLATARPKQ